MTDTNNTQAHSYGPWRLGSDHSDDSIYAPFRIVQTCGGEKR